MLPPCHPMLCQAMLASTYAANVAPKSHMLEEGQFTDPESKAVLVMSDVDKDYSVLIKDTEGIADLLTVSFFHS